MTEEVKDAQIMDVEEEAELPVPSISASSEDAGSAQAGIDVEAIAEKLLEKLDPVLDGKVDARFKSGKDVRYNKVEEIYEWVKASGGDPDKIRGALAESTLINRITALEAQIASGGAPGRATSGGALEQVATEILSQAGIELTDPLVKEWGSKKFPSEKAALKSLADSITKSVRQGGVSPAAAATVGSKSASVEGETYDSLAAELTGLRGKFDTESKKRRTEIQKKMGELEASMTFVENKYDAFGGV